MSRERVRSCTTTACASERGCTRMKDRYRDEETYQGALFAAFMGRGTILAWWSRNRTGAVKEKKGPEWVQGGS